MVSGLAVVSGLAPRWAAKQPHPRRCGLADTPSCLGLGLLRSPARGKPAHHSEPAHHENLIFSGYVTENMQPPTLTTMRSEPLLLLLLISGAPLTTLAGIRH